MRAEAPRLPSPAPATVRRAGHQTGSEGRLVPVGAVGRRHVTAAIVQGRVTPWRPSRVRWRFSGGRLGIVLGSRSGSFPPEMWRGFTLRVVGR